MKLLFCIFRKPCLTAISPIVLGLKGDIGAVYGNPKSPVAHILNNTADPNRLIPKIPHIPPQIINTIRRIVIAGARSGITKPLITESAATVRSGVLIRPEVTAASPIIRPPTILTAPPTALGSRRPAYLIISYIISTPTVSVIIENGAFCSDSARISRRVLFKSSGWCMAIAT